MWNIHNVAALGWQEVSAKAESLWRRRFDVIQWCGIGITNGKQVLWETFTPSPQKETSKLDHSADSNTPTCGSPTQKQPLPVLMPVLENRIGIILPGKDREPCRFIQGVANLGRSPRSSWISGASCGFHFPLHATSSLSIRRCAY